MLFRSNPVRDHIRNVAISNGWRCGPNIRGKEKETDAEALAVDLEILSQNRNVIFLGNWKLKLYSGL